MPLVFALRLPSRTSFDGLVFVNRESQAKETLLKPGQVYKYTIKVWPTSNLFKAGHQIRLEISSSNFPMFDRNPNTRHPFGQDAELKVADQTILHDKDHPSALILPVVPLAKP